MPKTHDEALASPQPSSWQQLLTNIEQSLSTLTEGASTPLALNMKMLALLADMEHAHQLLDALFAQWCTALPFAADSGMEVDWAQMGPRIGDAAKGLKDIARKAQFPLVIVDCPPKEGVWRSWRNELTYRREEGEPRDIFAPDYGRRLNPTLRENLWHVTADYITRYREKHYHLEGGKAAEWYPFNLQAFGGLRETMCHLSPEPHAKLAVMLRGKATQLMEHCTSLANLLAVPHEYVPDVEGAYSAFFDRLYKHYVEHPLSTYGTELRREQETWRNLYAPEGDISPSLATNRLAMAYDELEASGFAATWFAVHGLQGAQPSVRQRALHEQFFTDDGAVHSTSAGRYLFALQRTDGNGEQRARAFMSYAYIYKEMLPHLAPQRRATLTADEKHVQAAIASVVERDLITCDADWIAIYLVLNNQKITPTKGDYMQFYEQMRRMGFAGRFKGATPNKVCESLRKAYYVNVSGNGSPDEWPDILDNKQKQDKGRALDRYLRVATALKQALATTGPQG